MRAAPTATPSTWNSTLDTPTLSLAVAVKARLPARPLAKGAGVLMAMVGGWVSALGVLTDTATAALVAVAPLSSVARAVRL